MPLFLVYICQTPINKNYFLLFIIYMCLLTVNFYFLKLFFYKTLRLNLVLCQDFLHIHVPRDLCDLDNTGLHQV